MVPAVASVAEEVIQEVEEVPHKAQGSLQEVAFAPRQVIASSTARESRMWIPKARMRCLMLEKNLPSKVRKTI